MSTILFINIKELFQVREHTKEPLRGAAMNSVPSLKNAFLYIENGRIADYGVMTDFHAHPAEEVLDCSDQTITPGYVDSHTHLIFAATREREFEDRINGMTYEQIASRGGGILNSARKLGTMSEDDLFEAAKDRLLRLIQSGTTSIEIKSGYGLDVASEIKMLRVAKRLKEHVFKDGLKLCVKSTFLGAHAIPPAYKENRNDYIDLIVHEMLPRIADEDLADYIDVFCEKNYFTVKEMLRIIEAGSAYGLKAKVHVNQFNALGAIKAAVDAGAVSVDHLEVMNKEDFKVLSNSKTVATALPSCSFFLGLDYAPVKQMMENNIAIALASDYNPGSTPSGNMNFVWSLACIKMKMTPQQAFNAITINAAHALEIANETGSISKGKKADLLFFKNIEGLAAIPYHFGETLIDKVMVNGVFIEN